MKAHTENVELRFDDDSGDMLCKISMTPDGEMFLENESSGKISILQEGKFRIENNQEELLQIMEDFISAVVNMTTSTLPNPVQPPNNKAEFEALLPRIQNLRG